MSLEMVGMKVRGDPTELMDEVNELSLFVGVCTLSVELLDSECKMC